MDPILLDEATGSADEKLGLARARTAHHQLWAVGCGYRRFPVPGSHQRVGLHSLTVPKGTDRSREGTGLSVRSWD